MKRLALGIICCSAIVAACLVSARGEHTALQQVATPQKIQQLRAEGPAALDRLLAEREQLLRKRTEAAGHEKTIAALDAELARLNRVIDQVGGQVHCTASGLYWYTDLEQAKAAAMESGRPILSLRMLGNLTDEYSCANSRFFRTTLYANEKISNQLRESFVLHWK